MKKLSNLYDILKKNKAQVIYLIHDPKRDSEIRQFANKLRVLGFEPLVANDYRKFGEQAVKDAIARSDFSLVVAYDEETQRVAREQGVPFIEVVE